MERGLSIFGAGKNKKEKRKKEQAVFHCMQMGDIANRMGKRCKKEKNIIVISPVEYAAVRCDALLVIRRQFGLVLG